MRRSAAPSLQSSAKRFKFLSPFIDSTCQINKENDMLEFMEPEIAQDFKLLTSSGPKFEDITSSITKEETECSNLRSTNEILQLVLGTSCESKKNFQNSNTLELEKSSLSKVNNNFKSYNISTHSSSQGNLNISVDDKQSSTCTDPSITQYKSIESSVSHYNVLWCKRSAKKHKIWEGDGILIVRDRSAVLKNSEGKEIDRGMGYKLKDVSALEEGSKFFIGGKECEIQNLISSENIKKDENSVDASSSLPVKSQKLYKNSKKPKSCV